MDAGPDQTLIGKLFQVGSPPPAATLASRSAPSALSISGGLAGPDESTAGANWLYDARALLWRPGLTLRFHNRTR